MTVEMASATGLAKQDLIGAGERGGREEEEEMEGEGGESDGVHDQC